MEVKQKFNKEKRMFLKFKINTKKINSIDLNIFI
jgi:hypothetical protein